MARHVEMLVHPSDGIIVGRLIATSLLALLVFAFEDGATSERIGVVLLVIAFLQPILGALRWRRDTFLQAQMLSDIAAFIVFTLVAPEYYLLAIIVLAAELANCAVVAALSRYVVIAVSAIVAVIGVGAARDIDQFERAAGICIVLAVGQGYVGYKVRSSAACCSPSAPPAVWRIWPTYRAASSTWSAT